MCGVGGFGLNLGTAFKASLIVLKSLEPSLETTTSSDNNGYDSRSFLSFGDNHLGKPFLLVFGGINEEALLRVKKSLMIFEIFLLGMRGRTLLPTPTLWNPVWHVSVLVKDVVSHVWRS